jgi:hypothetical protein
MEDLIQPLFSGNDTAAIAQKQKTSLIQYVQSLNTTSRLTLVAFLLIWAAWSVTRHRRFYNDLVSPSAPGYGTPS